MPGILPMKVIKIGSSSQQTRIAQACDRCRSKKIRCDGIRPCCSQCANVGFECKTSDKLSRRAFPRGYTESLEERVRQLEAEVRELKDLLDEKDEKIDILSRIHSYSTYASQQNTPPRSNSTSLSPRADPETFKGEAINDKEDSFQVEDVPLFLGGDDNASFVLGPSSGRAFVDSFKRKIQQEGKFEVSFEPEAFFKPGSQQNSPLEAARGDSPETIIAPPRVLSDHLITIFFQEWAPLFPILHRPTFLTAYEQFVADEDRQLQQSDHVLAQLYLVFSIAALSSELRNQRDVDTVEQNIDSFERGWRKSLNTIVMDSSIETLQCLLLAQVSCILKADYTKLLHYRSLAVGLSQRLGLQQNQKRFSLGALTCETRKKVFWTLYTLDCFSAAMLGLPKMLKEADILAEYPADADDEYVTEKGFQATLPGESTKISSALALFRVSRILSKVLEINYPAAASYKLSLQKLQSLEDELDAWYKELAPHLKLQFVQDKPATNVINSRSPLLSLAYYYARTLIHRPAIGLSAGPNAASSIVALADSSKHIIQIVELLEERNLSFSFCFNKNELLVLSSFGLLFQGLGLNREGKLMKDNQRLLSSVVKILERNDAPGVIELRRLGEALMPVSRSPNPSARKTSPDVCASPQAIAHHPKSNHSRLSSIASRFSFCSSKTDPRLDDKNRRSTMPTTSSHNWVPSPSRSHHSFSSPRPEQVYRSHTGYPTSTPGMKNQLHSGPHGSVSADYLPYQADGVNEHSNRSTVASNDEWERLVGSIDNGQANIYDNIYGGLSVDALINMSLSSAGSDPSGWSPDIWGGPNDLQPAMAQSVHSVSEESLTSCGDEMSSCELASSHDDQYRGILMPNVLGHDGYCMEGMDGHFGL